MDERPDAEREDHPTGRQGSRDSSQAGGPPVEEWSSRLDRFRTLLAELRAKVPRAAAPKRPDLTRRIQELENRIEALQRRLDGAR